MDVEQCVVSSSALCSVLIKLNKVSEIFVVNSVFNTEQKTSYGFNLGLRKLDIDVISLPNTSKLSGDCIYRLTRSTMNSSAPITNN